MAPSSTPPKTPLNLLSYWHAVGTDNMRLVVREAGTSWGYFLQLAYGTRTCSYAMAKALIAAAGRLTPGWAPDLLTVMEGGGEHPPYRHGRKLGPSDAFLADQRARGLSGDARAMLEQLHAEAAAA